MKIVADLMSITVKDDNRRKLFYKVLACFACFTRSIGHNGSNSRLPLTLHDFISIFEQDKELFGSFSFQGCIVYFYRIKLEIVIDKNLQVIKSLVNILSDLR